MARPLNKMTEDGAAYTRPAAVEVSIDEALSQDLDVVLQRAVIRKPGHCHSNALAWYRRGHIAFAYG